MVLGPAGENWLLSTLILDNLNIQWGQAEAKTVAAYTDRSHWCGRQHGRESAARDFRLLHFDPARARMTYTRGTNEASENS